MSNRPAAFAALLTGLVLVQAGLSQGTAKNSPAAKNSLGSPAAVQPSPLLSVQPLPTLPDPYNLGLSTTSQKLQRLQQQLSGQKQLSADQKKQLESLRQNIASLSAQQKDVLGQIDRLENQIAGLQNQKLKLEQTIRAAIADLTQTKTQVSRTSGQVARLQADVRQLLELLYRERSGQYLRLINQANSLSDLVIRARYANMSGQHNVAVIEELRSQRLSLQAQQAQQTAQTAQLQDLRAQQLAQLTKLRDARNQQQALVARLQQTQAGKQALALQTQAQQALTAQSINSLVGNIVSERSRIEQDRRRRIEAERVRRAEELRRIREAQERARQEAARLAAIREAQRQEALRQAALQRAQAQAAAQASAAAEQRASQQRAAANAQEQASLRTRASQIQAQQQQASIELAPLPPASGPLGFPLPGGVVVANFSASVPWTVISAPEGSQAVAAQGGNVLAVTNYASLGWVVLIEHSASLATAYIGLDAPSVDVGARVVRGQALGTIGGSPVFGAGRMAFQVNRIAADNSRQAVPPTF
ncbi:peptidase M23 [Deinococcus psychrotolerans]|uniref:Peptidase M23 n=1 Tax=Deinococcus psychrotolerans TaxID=2489213 RepID=A0A3G8YA86_9DEIO|nr:peptidoglycan DD-metalloendopeptidase family protein [Deinococcus psychrotolerans]AZI42299.1 peptidase M23 [Deinococcus psychrotolerans]